MSKTSSIEVVIIGSGNLAWHLTEFFTKKKLKLRVYNHRNSGELEKIKKTFACETLPGLKNISNTADYYFVCVSDDHLSKVSKKIRADKENALVLHCSGSMPLNILKSKAKNTAVFYPLQSFSKDTTVDWNHIPIFIQGSSENAVRSLNRLLKWFPGKKVLSSDSSRLNIHLAAVMANNFTNAWYVQAFQQLEQTGNEKLFPLFLPLIKSGINKLERMSPLQAQTGPAKRGDKGVMKKHLQILKRNKDISALYKSMSALIAKHKK